MGRDGTNSVDDFCASHQDFRSGDHPIVNGAKYYLPLEFSNLAFHRFGLDRGCVQSERVAESATAAAIGKDTAGSQAFIVDGTPTMLRADGQAAATIDVSASDTAGNGLAGDHIHFIVGAQTGI